MAVTGTASRTRAAVNRQTEPALLLRKKAATHTKENELASLWRADVVITETHRSVGMSEHNDYLFTRYFLLRFLVIMM